VGDERGARAPDVVVPLTGLLPGDRVDISVVEGELAAVGDVARLVGPPVDELV